MNPTNRHRERGNVFLLVVIMMGCFMGLAALAVDGGHMYSMRSQCQATADGAALAAASAIPDTFGIRAAALDYATKNMPASEHGNVLVDSDVLAGNWDPDTRTFTDGGLPLNAVSVTIRRSEANGNPVDLTFGAALGNATGDVEARAIVAYDVAKKWDFVLTQDVTGSFTDELASAKDADQAMLDCIAGFASPETRLGVVSYTGWGQPLQTPVAIGTGYSGLSSVISSISSCGTGGAPLCSGTNIAAGLKDAVEMLASVELLDDHAQAIILVTDGQPTANSSGEDPGLSAKQLGNLAVTWADAADAAGISVFTIFYDADGNDAAATYLESLVRGDGIFLRTPDPSQLPVLMQDICNATIRWSLVQ